MKKHGIAVLDFGGQYVHLIATKMRALGVYAEIREPDDTLDSYRGYQGIILSGSPALSARGEEAGWTKGILGLGIPRQRRARAHAHTARRTCEDHGRNVGCGEDPPGRHALA